MAKYREPFNDVEEVFQQALSDAGLEQVVKMTVVVNDSMKEIGKIRKTPDLLKFFSGADVLLELNEEIFEKLEDGQKRIVADDFLSRVYFDSEKDKVVINKPDVVTSTGIIDKYGADEVLRLTRTIKDIHNQQEDEKEQEEVAQ